MPPAVRAGSWRDPVLITVAVSAVVVVGAFLLDVGTPRAQLIAGAIVGPVLDLALTWLALRVCRVPGLPSHARRFWGATGAAGLLFLAGDLVQLVTVVTDPGIQRLAFHPAQSATMMLGVLVMLVGLLLPQRVASRSRRERTRLLLDAAILMSASAVVAWCLMTRPGMAEAGPAALFLALFGCGVVLCAVFAGIRSGLTGVSPMSRAAAVPMITASIGLAAASVLLPSGSVPGSGAQMALTIFPCFLVLAGPRLQLLDGVDGLDGREWFDRRRRYSVLPYAGTLVCAVALVFVLADRGLGVSAWGALAGLLVNVGLVIARQVLALDENDSLVGEIRHREQRLTSLLEHSSEIISIADPAGGFLYVSPAVERILGFPVEEALGRCSLDILHRDDRARLAAGLDELYAKPGVEMTFQGRYRHADGSWRWLEVVAVNLTGEPGIDGVVCNSRDVTESRELHERLRYQAGHDDLTGLANRRGFTAAMEACPADATVLLIDLNGFKGINDTYGHATGDAVLRHVADLLRDCAGPDDVPARLGGDEFAVLTGDDRPAADRMVERMRARFATPAVIDGREVTVGASIGAATGPAGGGDHLLNTADLLMYEEKQRSRAWTS
ncbi:diguanylate cyclase domain-containing protein [Actinoplanes sp. CA-252034]|uniref:diguanylate cyclase domain-containing protein n=1 Tax=Actinoplanes sp. CA-252034 TaxID=3239906 RepID=UPI003D9643DF